MFKLKFSKTYDNVIFTKYQLKPVVEDYFKAIGNSFCIADGVTRDDVYGNAVKYPTTKEEAINWIKRYPNPSGAYKAAEIICEKFISNITSIPDEKISENVIRREINKANKELEKINKCRKIDYLKDDYYCCEAVGGRFIEDKLYCFSIGDCHITILDKDYNVIFTTINNHKRFEIYKELILKHEKKLDWNLPETRVLIRKEYRNNPQKKYKGKDITFGALSGEKNAEYYIDTYCVDLNNAKYICAYSDGCEEFFSEEKKISNLINNLDILKNEGPERTLLVYENVK